MNEESYLQKYMSYPFFRKELSRRLGFASISNLLRLNKRIYSNLSNDKALLQSQDAFEKIVKSSKWSLLQDLFPFEFDPTPNSNFAIRRAIKDGQLEIFKYFISMHSQFPEIENSLNSNQLLLKACKHGQVEIVKFILSLKPQFPNIDISFQSNTCLSTSIRNNKVEMTKFVLSLLKEQFPDYVLLTRQMIDNAIYDNCLEVLDFLLTQIDTTNLMEMKYFIRDSHSKSQPLANMLLLKKTRLVTSVLALFEITDIHNQSLYSGARTGSIPLIQTILDIKKDYGGAMRELMTRPQDPPRSREYANPNNIAFGIACEKGNMKTIKFLIESKDVYPRVDAAWNDCRSIFVACESGHVEVLEYLLSLKNIFYDIELSTNNWFPVRVAYVRKRENVISYFKTIQDKWPGLENALNFFKDLSAKGNNLGISW